MVLAIGITLLIIMGISCLWIPDRFKEGLWLLASAAVLTFVFFRKRMVVLIIGFFAFILVNAGLTALVRPTLEGILATVGAAAGLVALIKWHATQYPELIPADWKMLFENRTHNSAKS